MVRQAYDRFRAWQTNLNSSFGTNISTRKGRWLAKLHTHLVDHAWIRLIWTNMYPVSDGVWRSNQPDPRRIRKLKAMGIRTIINLRGPSAFAVYLFEKEACEANDITLYSNILNAFKPSQVEWFLSLLDIFDTVEKPLLIHCKSGADRAGIASALYLIHRENVPVDVAMQQLSLKFAHRKNSRAGVQGHLLETYARDAAEAPITLRKWFETRYDAEALAESFRIKRGKPSK